MAAGDWVGGAGAHGLRHAAGLLGAGGLCASDFFFLALLLGGDGATYGGGGGLHVVGDGLFLALAAGGVVDAGGDVSGGDALWLLSKIECTSYFILYNLYI